MTVEEAFERAYWDGRAVERVEELTDWSWLEEHYNQALIAGDVVAAGYCAGRMSRRGELLLNEQGMVFSYEV